MEETKTKLLVTALLDKAILAESAEFYLELKDKVYSPDSKPYRADDNLAICLAQRLRRSIDAELKYSGGCTQLGSNEARVVLSPDEHAFALSALHLYAHSQQDLCSIYGHTMLKECTPTD